MEALVASGVVVALILGVLGLAFATIASRRASGASASNGRRLDDIDARLRAVETALIQAPTRGDVKHIDARLDQLATQLAVNAEQLRAAAASIGRIEDYMMQRGAHAPD